MTKSLNFPIPYPGQSALDDLATARLMLSAVQFYLDDSEPLVSQEVQSLFNVLCAAMEKLEIIQLFLDGLECDDIDAQYQDARRLWIMQKGGAK